MAGFMPWLEKLVRILSFGRFSLTGARSNPLKEFYSYFPNILAKKKRNWIKSKGQGQEPADIMELFLDKVEETTDKSSPFHALGMNYALT